MNSKLVDKYRLPSPKDVDIFRQEEHAEMFSKTKVLKRKTDSFLLPPLEKFCSTPAWKIPELEFLKKELIRVKSSLNEMKIKEWHLHTRNANPLSSVIKRIRSSVTHEFCSIAWCKLFEILSCHNAIPDGVQEAAYQLNDISLDSVHLCEAPGAFISALNHFLHTNYENVRWNWVATTLNPYYEGNDRSETLIQDQIILSTLNNWTFFEENTGNIMKSTNIRSLQQDTQAKGLKNVQLITADGSVDCADAPDEQENITSGLHYCEMLAALEVLGRGGTFVLKLFTFFECNTICKLYILSCFFEEVHVVKPAMSKEGNSEVYMICRGFVGREFLTAERQFLLELCDALPDKAIFPLETIPQEFIRRVIQCSHFYATLQAKVILRNVKTYELGKDFYNHMKYTKESFANYWFQMTGLVSLPRNKFLLHLDKVKQKFYFTYQTAWDQFTGSYNERKSQTQIRNQPEWIESMQSELEALQSEFNCEPFKVSLPACHKCSVQYGKSYESVKCSRFCSDKILQLLRSMNEYLRGIGHHVDTPKSCSSCFCLPPFDVAVENPDEPPVQVICYRSGNSHPPCFAIVDLSIPTQFLSRLWTKLNELIPSQSLFLCGVPLLTRAVFGTLALLRTFFESAEAMLEMNESQRTSSQGVLFKNFKGESANKVLWSELQGVMTSYPGDGDRDPVHPSVLEVVPVTVLCSRKPCQGITAYNNYLLLNALKDGCNSAQWSDSATGS